MNFLGMNEPFILSALTIALGYTLKKLHVLHEHDGEALARVALNITLPAVILTNITGAQLDGTNLLLPLFGLAASIPMVLIALGFFRNLDGAERGLAMTASSGFNIGLLALPVISGMYGPEGITRYALFDIGNVISIFGISWYLAWYYSPLRGTDKPSVLGVLRMFLKSLPFMVSVAAIVLNITGVPADGLVFRLIAIPAAMNKGTSLLALGLLLRFKFPTEVGQQVRRVLSLRFVYALVVGIPILLFLPVAPEYRATIAGAMVMPVGLALIPYAVRWGYDRNAAAAILNTAIPVSFVLLWVIWYVTPYLPVYQP